MKILDTSDGGYAHGPVTLLASSALPEGNSVGLELEVSSQTWDAKQDAWSLDVAVVYDGIWNVSTKDAWLSVLMGDPGHILIYTTKNTTGSVRTGTVTIKPLGAPAEDIIVKQAAETPNNSKLALSVQSLTIPATGGRLPFHLTCKRYWNANSLNNWAFVESGTGKDIRYSGAGKGNADLFIKVGANPVRAKRVSSVTFRSDKHIVSLRLIQEPKADMIEATPAPVTLPKGANTVNVQITSDPDWTCVTTTQWITAVKTSPTRLTITVTANPGTEQRSSTVTLRAGTASLALPVIQAA